MGVKPFEYSWHRWGENNEVILSEDFKKSSMPEISSFEMSEQKEIILSKEYS